MQTLDAIVRGSVTDRRALMQLLGLFGGLALLLAGVGVYAVAAQAVLARRREIGLRLAIGASPRRVFRGVLQREAVPVVFGLAVGLAAAMPASRPSRRCSTRSPRRTRSRWRASRSRSSCGQRRAGRPGAAGRAGGSGHGAAQRLSGRITLGTWAGAPHSGARGRGSQRAQVPSGRWQCPRPRFRHRLAMGDE